MGVEIGEGVVVVEPPRRAACDRGVRRAEVEIGEGVVVVEPPRRTARDRGIRRAENRQIVIVGSRFAHQFAEERPIRQVEVGEAVFLDGQPHILKEVGDGGGGVGFRLRFELRRAVAADLPHPVGRVGVVDLVQTEEPVRQLAGPACDITYRIGGRLIGRGVRGGRGGVEFGEEIGQFFFDAFLAPALDLFGEPGVVGQVGIGILRQRLGIVEEVHRDFFAADDHFFLFRGFHAAQPGRDGGVVIAWGGLARGKARDGRRRGRLDSGWGVAAQPGWQGGLVIAGAGRVVVGLLFVGVVCHRVHSRIERS